MHNHILFSLGFPEFDFFLTFYYMLFVCVSERFFFLLVILNFVHCHHRVCDYHQWYCISIHTATTVMITIETIIRSERDEDISIKTKPKTEKIEKQQNTKHMKKEKRKRKLCEHKSMFNTIFLGLLLNYIL